MIFKRLSTGMLASNCYIIGAEAQSEGVVIDPGAESAKIIEEAKKLGLNIKHIFLTHSHIDHICSMDELRKMTGAKVYLHKLEAYFPGDARLNGAVLFGRDDVFEMPDILLEHGNVIEAGGLRLQIIHTPGHSPGGICIKVDDIVFTGDTLFKMSIGRSDLGNGDMDDLLDSIHNKLMKLEDHVIVYPGHGTHSTIGYERENNPLF